MPLRAHTERARWWTTETTTFETETRIRCSRCGGDGYGQYGDGYRCHDCGRIVIAVMDDRDLGVGTDGC